MSEPERILTIRAVRELILEGDPPTVRELGHALDRLALAYWHCPEGTPDERDVEGNRDYQALYASVGARFPGLGLYRSVFSTLDLQDEAGISDAIDDLCDIALDLNDVLLHLQKFGEKDANWHFRFHFEYHLGPHLRDLSKHLHDLLRDQATDG